MCYIIYVRTFWRIDANGKRHPEVGRSRKIDSADTEEEARQICKEWNSTHNPGPRSKKAEYTTYKNYYG